ncbi:protein FAR-RED ELONGATED HYPOCOTYL 3-like [Arachis stenosperma]|uniref:protein FAR-RED ELONGATED HYPOCOTYL 3-like n=1 Tax=Arachis stenosperma TaxID=217475 RepID=UPI0025AB5ED4|nr:protein FAR-RED ELONGATED HYPOCOTYL 3-like [Arachis stenosperma]
MSVHRTIENNEEAGIRPSKTYQSFVAAAGGHHELNFIEKDVRNYITREVRNISEQENAKKFGKYLLRMKEKNQNFFFELELEGDQSIKLAFWADARSRAAFEYFGDVILFDTTYNTNRDWNDFLLKYGLMDNKWLSDLYEDHHIWVPIYLDHHFWAGIKSTQRSESMHSFFNKFITRNSSLIQFVKQYDNCLGSREQAERESNDADFHAVIPCATKSSIEAQFQHVNTHQKFRKVQAQFRGNSNCITRLTNSALGYSVYEVGEQVFSSIFNKFVITYDSVAAQVKCQCLLFESRESKELAAIMHRAYDNVMVEMEELKAKRKGTCLLSHEDPNLESVNELQSPPMLNLFDAASVVRPNSSQYQGRIMNYQFREPAVGDSFLDV